MRQHNGCSTRRLLSVEAEFRGDHDLIANRPQSLPDDLLIAEWSIDFRRIEEGHAAFHGRSDEGHTLLVAEGMAIHDVEAHAAKANG